VRRPGAWYGGDGDAEAAPDPRHPEPAEWRLHLRQPAGDWYDYGRQREPVARSMAARWESRWGAGRARLEHDPPPPPREVEDGREQLALLPSLRAAPLDRHRAPPERRPRPADDAAPALPGQVALPLRTG
jgi:hypothetical protein